MKALRLSAGLASIVVCCCVVAANSAWISCSSDRVEAAPEVRVLESTLQRVVLEVRVAGFRRDEVLLEGQAFDALSLPVEGRLSAIGSPQLPTIGRLIVVPDDAMPILRIVSATEIVLPDYHVVPATHKWRCGDEASCMELNAAVYDAAELYPPMAAELSAINRWRDLQIARVQINPLRWSPATGELAVTADLQLEVTFLPISEDAILHRAAAQQEKLGSLQPEGLASEPESGSDPSSSRGSDPSRPESLLDSARLLGDSSSLPPIAPGYDQLYRRFLLNYDQFAREVAAVEPMLIITADEFATSIAPLAEWKRMKGIPVTVTLKSQVGTTATAVKNFLLNAYNTWNPRPVYVLLVGDVAQLPTNFGIGNCASDYMYTTLAGNDLDPELFIGRISAQTTADVDNQVAKIVNYEKYPIAGEPWRGRMTGISSSQTGPAGISDDQRVDAIRDQWLSWGAGLVDRLYVSNGGATAVNLSNAVNQGRTWLTYMGHGSGTSWSSPFYSEANVDALANGSLNPVIVDISCMNGGFTRSGGDCFAERWMKTGSTASPRGAVGMFSASTNTAWDESGELGEGVAFAYADAAEYSWGAAAQGGLLWLEAQMGSANNVLEVFQQYVLFGDPSMEVFTGAPQILSISMSSAIATGGTDVGFLAMSGGQPVAGALICCRKGEEMYVVGRTNAVGRAMLNLAPQTAGAVEVTVTALNCTPFFGAIQVRESHCGVVMFDKDVYSCSQVVNVTVWDADLDQHAEFADVAEAEIWSTSQSEPQLVELTETGQSTAEFTGAVQLSESPGGGGTLLVSDEDTITVRYSDTQCDGSPVTRDSTALLDCRPPIISSVTVTNRGATNVTIEWETDEFALGSLWYGLTAPPDQHVDETVLAVSHRIVIEGLAPCSRYVFTVAAADYAGNQAVDDNEGSYYEMETFGEIVLYAATMDSDPGWTVSGGQWAWGTPQGLGGPAGCRDPIAGHTGTTVFGYNLSGDYGSSIIAYSATTPPIDCSTASGISVSFYRWLGVEAAPSDYASFQASSDGVQWHDLFRNLYSVCDAQWVLETYDISAYADGRQSLRLRWVMGPTDSSVTYCGWNIDDVKVSYLIGCAPTFTPTNTPTTMPTATPTLTPTATDSSTPTLLPTTLPTDTPTVGLTMTATPSPEATATPPFTAVPSMTGVGTLLLLLVMTVWLMGKRRSAANSPSSGSCRI